MTAVSRRTELAQRLRELRERVNLACAQAGRDPHEVDILAVTKFFPASDVAILAELGLRSFGESRHQEAAAKVAELAQHVQLPQLRWHMIGQLQRNKIRGVLAWADQVDSVSTTATADALARAVAEHRDSPLDVLIQVSLDGDPRRGGCPIAEVPRLADHIADRAELALRGVMAIAPRDQPPAAAFATLMRVAVDLRSAHPSATEISAGMSGDLTDAIAAGSTCVRVGTALLGSRTLSLP